MGKFGLEEDKLSGKTLKKSVTDDVRSNLGGILSVNNSGKFVSGARCTIKINGVIAVFASRVSWRVNTEQDEIWTIDSTTPYEMAPKRITVEGSIGGFHIPGWTPSAQGIQSDVLSFMFHKYISIEVRDRNTDTILFLTNRAVVTSWQEDINAENLAQLSLSWKAIGWLNELGGDGLNGLTHPMDPSETPPPK